MGQIKGESNDSCHLLPCINVTGSGLNERFITHLHMTLKESQGLNNGLAVLDIHGTILNYNDIDQLLINILEEMYDKSSEGFPAKIDTKEKIGEHYHCFRTFRRTSDTQALNAGVMGYDVDIVNCWQKKEQAGTNMMNGPMKQHYADFELLIKPFKRHRE